MARVDREPFARLRDLDATRVMGRARRWLPSDRTLRDTLERRAEVVARFARLVGRGDCVPLLTARRFQ